METINLNLKKTIDNSYDILISENLLNKIPLDLKENKIGNRYLIITDSNVEKIFGKKLLVLMKRNGLKTDLISFKGGEQSKNLIAFHKLLYDAHQLGLDRKSAIIALGGGVVGDIAGFASATYMRGISFIQIPTTLLAMTDSSIGGKTAVNLKSGKNIVGAFHQPKKVYIDTSLLKTLPKKEWLNGLAEIIKHALIQDKKLFDFIDKNLDKIGNNDDNYQSNQFILIQIIKRNCEIKASIVEKDEKENGLRKILNYGHTIGHTLESLTAYKKYSHGEAIAIGMVVEGLISNKMGMLSTQELLTQNKMINKIGLPVKIPKLLDTNKIICELKKDKKVIGGRIEFVLLERIGKAIYGINVSNKIIREAIEEAK